MGPAVLIPIGVAAVTTTTIVVAARVNDDSEVPNHRGSTVVRYKCG